jgi:phage shock protein A
MGREETDLTGMGAGDAKEYIVRYMAALKLAEKKLTEAEAEEAKWNGRAALARSKGIEDLAREAENQAGRAAAQREQLSAETSELRSQIEVMRKQVPGLAARERSIDPDLLEQNLLMAAGYNPGEEERAANERRLKEMEQNASVDAELAALKAKYNCPPQ